MKDTTNADKPKKVNRIPGFISDDLTDTEDLFGDEFDFSSEKTKKISTKPSVDVKAVSKKAKAIKPKKESKSSLATEKRSSGDLMAQIEALKQENAELRGARPKVTHKFTANERKLLDAIKTEQSISPNQWATISSTKLRKVYKVHPNYFRASFDSLVALGLVERQEVSYSGDVITYKYRAL